MERDPTELHHVIAIAGMYTIVYFNLVLLCFFPRLNLTFKWMNSPWIHILPGIPYCFYIVPGFFEALVNFANMPILSHGFFLPSFSSVDFYRWWSGTPHGTVSFWLHMAIIDIFAARWMWMDALRRGVKSWWPVGGIISFSFLFPGAGPLLYIFYKTVVLKGSFRVFDGDLKEELLKGNEPK